MRYLRYLEALQNTLPNNWILPGNPGFYSGPQEPTDDGYQGY